MRFTFITLTCLFMILTTVPGLAKEKNSEMQMDMQAMMEMYQKLATPGEPHKLFASLAGSWTTHMKEWMEPGKPPNGINWNRRNEDVAGWPLSLPGIHRPDDGQTIFRDWDRRLRQYSEKICHSLDGYNGYRNFSDGRYGQSRWQNHQPHRTTRNTGWRTHEPSDSMEVGGCEYPDV